MDFRTLISAVQYILDLRPAGTILGARLPIDGRLATGDGADREGWLKGGRCVGRMDGCVFT